MKTGIIISYNKEREIGTIFVNDAVGTRFFFYASKVISGLPSVGANVIFDVSPKQVRPGQLAVAIHIVILPPEIGDDYEKAVSYAIAFDLKRRGIDPLSEGIASQTDKAGA